MKYFLLSYILLQVVVLRAQSQPELLWSDAEFVGNGPNFDGVSIGFDAQSNLYTSTSQSDQAELYGLTLIKYDTLGNQNWNISTGLGELWHRGSNIVVDSGGNVFRCANYEFTPENFNSKIVKYSTNGDVLWTRKYLLDTIITKTGLGY